MKFKIAHIKQLFKHFDKNNDGVINYNEFKEGIKSIKNHSNKGLHKRFRKRSQK